jgi:ADP-heptose:LPS heptosyltransferase
LVFHKEKIKKILIIKFGGIGDVLLSTPVLPNLREFFPDAIINFLTYQNCIDAVKDNPYINRALSFKLGDDTSYCFLKNIKKQKYDLIIDLFGNPRTAFATFYSFAKYRVGFKFRHRRYAYNIKVDGRGGEVHNVEFNLDAIRKINCPVNSKKLFIATNNYHEEFADIFIKNTGLNKSPIGIVISGGWETKKYKTDDYKILIKKILEKYDAEILLMWGIQPEKEQCEIIKKDNAERIFVTPECDIKYLSAIMKKCKFVIGNDSGLIHLAVASDVPVLGIYGPTNPLLQGPFGENNITVVNEKIDCLNCNLLECPIGNICMTELSKDVIMEKIEELISKNKIEI